MYGLDYDDKMYPTREEIDSFRQTRLKTSEESSMNPDATPHTIKPVAIWKVRKFEADRNSEVDDAFCSKRLIMNVRVYAAAEKYDISTLKDLSKEKFNKLEYRLPRCYFPPIIHEVLTTTPSSDRGLRNTILEVCTERAVMEFLSNGEGSDDWEGVLKGDPDFLMEIIRTANAKSISSAKHDAAVIEAQRESIPH